MSKAPIFGIVAGEKSGDILGAGLMVALRERYPDAEFVGIGGPDMIALGFQSLFPMERLSVMGFVEPLGRLPELFAIKKQLRKYFSANPPAAFIGIDSPDFNLRLEEELKQQNIKTVHYVSPSVWAYRKKRIYKVMRSVDLMLTLFPFETAVYEQHNVAVPALGIVRVLVLLRGLKVDQRLAGVLYRLVHVLEFKFLVSYLPRCTPRSPSLFPPQLRRTEAEQL